LKGIILAGGLGTRLYPITKVISKHILPVYDKPMIYYPLSVLMLADIREILIISTPRDINLYKELFNDGRHLGLNIDYAIQKEPRGLADAFLVAEKFIGNDRVALILGDNIFYGQNFVKILEKVNKRGRGATVFGYYVKNPQQYGVVEFDKDFNVLCIEEKPVNPKSNYVVPGLYFYDNNVIDIAKNLVPSKRGELEITDVNKEYLKRDLLKVELLGRGMTWLDAGTHEGLLEASNFIEVIQKRQGLYIACIEEIAYRKKYLNSSQMVELAKQHNRTEYSKYLLSIIE